MKIPHRVQHCTTHHYACDCREWRYEQMESALKIIATWASVEVDNGKPEMQLYVNMAKEALEEGK
ncbi:MAG: hypothetical protein RBT40_13005 [Petrimonas sp.]|nr:hypothetical protein [Petrimonas sp.]